MSTFTESEFIEILQRQPVEDSALIKKIRLALEQGPLRVGAEAHRCMPTYSGISTQISFYINDEGHAVFPLANWEWPPDATRAVYILLSHWGPYLTASTWRLRKVADAPAPPNEEEEEPCAQVLAAVQQIAKDHSLTYFSARELQEWQFDYDMWERFPPLVKRNLQMHDEEVYDALGALFYGY